MDLQITGYELQRIASGGYRISRKAGDVLPAGSRLLLGVSPGLDDHVDVTRLPARDMISPVNMVQLLRIFRKHGWPRKLEFRLFHTQGSSVLGSSSPHEIKGPVEPHSGALVPLEPRWRGVYKYLFKTGAGYHDSDGHSRALEEVPGIGLFWTDIGDKFETDPDHRGFSCVGYVAAVCGVRSAAFWGTRGETALSTLDGVLGVTSADLLKYLGEAGVRLWLTNRPANDVVNFFRGGKLGHFIVWRQGEHTTMVIGQTQMVHEFNRGGYKVTALEPRVRRVPDGWSVAQLSSKPGLAAF